MASSFVTQAEFSRHRGVSRKTVSVWKSRGLLVLRSDGLVDVAASDKRLSERPFRYRGGLTTQLPGNIGNKFAPDYR